MKQYYFTIKGCDKVEDDTLKNVTVIEVLDTTVENALEQAKKLIVKNEYIVTNIIEKSEKI
jgi:hypothetical protein